MSVVTAYHHKFRKIGDIPFALHYGDIRIVSTHARCLPDDVDTSYRLSKNCGFLTYNPVIPATMDTICEAPMAIHASLNGSFGIIHKGLTPERQAEEINKVKRYKAGYIQNPVTLLGTTKISDANRVFIEKGYGDIPIVDLEGKAIGLLERRSYDPKRHSADSVLSFMTPIDDVVCAKSEESINDVYDRMVDHRVTKALFLDEKSILGGMATRTDIESADYLNPSRDKYGRRVVGGSIGGPGRDLKRRLELLFKEEVDILCADTSQFDSDGGAYTIKTIKKEYGDEMPIIGGNVDNWKSAENLIGWGVDIIKDGIAPGIICETGPEIGAGIPEFSSVWEVAEATREHGVSVIADGGFRERGDVVKAIAAGAKAVMSGYFFAGTDETPGEVKTIKQGEVSIRVKEYSGMASPEALKRSGGGRYYMEGVPLSKIAVQGKTITVPYKGPVDDEFAKLLNALKFSMAIHCGSKTIDELSTHSDLEFALLRR